MPLTSLAIVRMFGIPASLLILLSLPSVVLLARLPPPLVLFALFRVQTGFQE